MGSLLQPHFKMTPHRMMRKLKMITGITGDFICRHHVEPRVKLYMPKEESFSIPFKYIDITRTTHTSLDVLLEKQNDYWNVDGERKISDAWTGFTRFILLNERPLDGYTWSGKRLMRKQTTSRPVNVWPDMWKHMSDAVNKKAKQRWPIKRTKLDNARQSRGIFFTEPDDEEIQNSMKNAGRKLEIPMQQQCLVKHQQIAAEKPAAILGKNKTRYACIVDADGSMRIRLKVCRTGVTEDHISAKGINSLSHCNLVHKFIPMPQALNG